MFIRAAAIAPLGLFLGLLSPLPADDAHLVQPTADIPAKRGDAPAGVGQVVLHGLVLLPDDGSPIGLRAHLVTPTRTDSADIDAAGSFDFILPRIDCDSADIRIDARDPTMRRYHTARLRVAMPSGRVRDTVGTMSIRVLLVPTSYTIAGGSYAGTVVPISVAAAFAGAGERTRYWRVSRSASARGVPIGWPDERFPLPVAVSGRSSSLAGADSAAFWAIARQLERDVGRTLFRPISIDSARSEGWSVTLSVDPAEHSPGITFITHDGWGDLFDATIAIRSSPLLSDERVVTHELVHALGFGHAVGWHSVMNSPFQASARATATDVAYAQLFYRLRRMHIEQGATHGILDSAADMRGPRADACVSAHTPADARGEHRSLLQPR